MMPPDERAGVLGHRRVEEALLNDPSRLLAADPSGMLRALASAGAQVRESAALAAEANLTALADGGRPPGRSSWPASAPPPAPAICSRPWPGRASPVPVVGHRSAGIPGWVGAADAVIAVSASGRSPEALAAADAAGRRGARLVAIGPPDSELQALAERARAPFVPVPRRAPARASLWALTVPVLLAARTLGLVRIAEADFAETATRLDEDAERCRPGADSFVNPAKALALDLANSIPIVVGARRPWLPWRLDEWGTCSRPTRATRSWPARSSEAGRGRVGLVDGIYGGLVESERDIFADPRDEPEPTRLRLLVLARRRARRRGTPGRANRPWWRNAARTP